MILPGHWTRPITAGQELGPTSGTPQGAVREQVGARRGRNIGVVAAARQLIELVFHGLRDGHIRCLAPPPPCTPAA